MGTRKYKNPPLVEVVCEFKFELENQFDPILPGLLYSEIEKDFPVRKPNVIPTIKDGVVNPDSFPNPLSRFYSKDETALVQVGLNILSVNCVKEYPNWEVYKPMILDVLDKYLAIAKPQKIDRIGLRAINKVIIKSKNIKIDEYFKSFFPSSPIDQETPLSGFQMIIEKHYNEERDVLKMKNGTIVVEEGSTGFLLDFDYIMNMPGAINRDQVDEWLEIAHDKNNSAFEACITDKLRGEFSN